MIRGVRVRRRPPLPLRSRRLVPPSRLLLLLLLLLRGGGGVDLVEKRDVGGGFSRGAERPRRRRFRERGAGACPWGRSSSPSGRRPCFSPGSSPSPALAAGCCSHSAPTKGEFRSHPPGEKTSPASPSRAISPLMFHS